MTISHRFLALLLFLVIANATQAAVSAETPVGTPAYDTAPGYQTNLSVAASGSGYFAVWRDGRSFRSDDLIGTRISESGETLDPTGIFIARGPVFQPRVVWNGSSFLVMWSSDPGYGPAHLFAARVDREGRVVMPPTLVLRDALAIGDFLASDGTRSIALYMSRESGREGALRAAVLDHEAAVVTDLELAPADLSRGAPSIETNGSEYVVVWTMTHDGIAELQAIRLGPSGTRLDAAPASLGRGYEPLIASDGHDFVVAARTPFNGESVWTTRAVSVSLSDVSDPELIAGSGNMFEASFFWAGGQYALVGPRFDFAISQYHAALVSVERDGSPSEIREADFVPTKSLSPSMDAVADGSDLVIVWTESSERPSGVVSRTVARLYSQAGSVLEPQSEKELLTTSANRQMNPVIAAGGSIRLVAWREESGIYATRVNAAGVSLDGRGLELYRDANAGPPSVAFDGSQFVVAWTASPTDLVARFVSTDGRLLPGTVRFYGDVRGPIGLTAGGPGSLLAWTTNEPQIVVARISRATRDADPVPLAISPAGRLVGNPVPSWNGREFLVAWNEMVLDYAGLQIFFSSDRVLGSRLTDGLTLIDTEPLLIGDAEGSDAGQRLASDGQDWLVAWRGGSQIRGQRILGGRVFGPQEGTPISAGIGHDVAWEGSRYAMTWKNGEENLQLGSIERKGATGPVSPQLIGSARGVSGPFLASIGPHTLAIVYGRIATEPLHGSVERAFLRTVTPDGPRRRAVR